MNNEGKRVIEPEKVEKTEPDPDALWDEILQKIAPTGDSGQDDPWKSVVAEIPQKDAQQRLDAQRFQGQGQ